jgi:hypothetical protein
MIMEEPVTVTYTTQWIENGADIGGNLFADQDADTIRYWEGEHCLLEMSVDPDGNGWVPTGGDVAAWADLGELPFSTPRAALVALLPPDSYTLVCAD